MKGIYVQPVDLNRARLTPGAPLWAQFAARVVEIRRLVSVVDDDESVRESLPDLLRSFGLEVQAFASAEMFLASDALERTGCLVLDVAMPGMSGPQLQQELARLKHEIPIVFITANSEERVRPMVTRRGAVAYLVKPFSETAILEAVTMALSKA
jgi:FixJ family two-component response regulator